MIFHIYANQTNIGDWVSAKGIQKLLGTEQLIECFCDEPFINETIEKLSSAKKNDLIIIGGGGLLMDYFTPFWKSFEPISNKIPFCIWGIGFCDIKQEKSLPPLDLIRKVIKKSRLCIVRDNMSYDHLDMNEIQIPVQCPSINYISALKEKGHGLLHVVNYSTVGEISYTEMCKISKKWCTENSITYTETNNLVEKGSTKKLEILLDTYRRSGLVISSALHGCIIGATMGLKVIAVSGDYKIEGFMQSIQLGKWVLNQSETDKIESLLQNISYQPDISPFIDEARKKNIEIANTIKSIYSSINS